MSKPSRETIRKRIATRRRNAAARAARLRGGAAMNNEISEEAKLALAKNRRGRALARLRRDGSHSDRALQRRVLVIAAERNIPPADYAKLFHKRIGNMAVMEFCKKHKISFDWLLAGDLKGLQRMKQWASASAPKPQPHPQPLEEDWRHLLKTFGRLNSAARAAVVSYLKTQINVYEPDNAS